MSHYAIDDYRLVTNVPPLPAVDGGNDTTNVADLLSIYHLPLAEHTATVWRQVQLGQHCDSSAINRYTVWALARVLRDAPDPPSVADAIRRLVDAVVHCVQQGQHIWALGGARHVAMHALVAQIIAQPLPLCLFEYLVACAIDRQYTVYVTTGGVTRVYASPHVSNSRHSVRYVVVAATAGGVNRRYVLTAIADG